MKSYYIGSFLRVKNYLILKSDYFQEQKRKRKLIMFGVSYGNIPKSEIEEENIGRLIEKFESDDMIESRQTISPSNFFSFRVVSSRIRYRDFVDSCLEFGELECDFRLEPESF
jgi:hypothetical protein